MKASGLSEEKATLTGISKTDLGTASEIGIVQGNGSCLIEFGIQNHDAGMAGSGSLREIQVSAIIGPKGLHTISRTLGKYFTRPRGETVFAHLKPSTHCGGEGETVTVLGIPRGFGAVRTDVRGNAAQSSGRERNFVNLGLSPTVRSNDQTPSVGRPGWTGLVAFVSS